jgi:hypothetical protein
VNSQQELLDMAATEAVEKHGLYHSGDGNWRGSRDYGLENVPCAVLCCPVNRNAFCASPAAIKIKANGKCEVGELSLDEAYKLAKEKARQPIDGD